MGLGRKSQVARHGLVQRAVLGPMRGPGPEDGHCWKGCCFVPGAPKALEAQEFLQQLHARAGGCGAVWALPGYGGPGPLVALRLRHPRAGLRDAQGTTWCCGSNADSITSSLAPEPKSSYYCRGTFSLCSGATPRSARGLLPMAPGDHAVPRLQPETPAAADAPGPT